ncbi:MAG: hypothetical protein COV59_03980 [Candidatus Magasanikbacteria bacterium CG11_big_fil_rev_8_21_14_0_20_39_34]|uniref:SGNH hydrolase-type esterase domain-containing protein n=1 Tax=Candidatus Magasanikbacteria bacterium CG11_big_fil_rev_8_21_14_0_20_39_34 TaxID=1974653 RepID=A0A2H0N4I7_9BACT|nr:MAG: hypothetical protein COV59_03980 [Candidatus Magasanikbacteria bacterium CG11_big_fil_rev_8_21_14_0_20_39_34]
MEAKRITIFGDSITWGKADNEFGGWVNRLRCYCDEMYNYDVEIYNVGVSGDTTDDILQRFDGEATARNRKPQRFVFAIGINDSYYDNTEENPKVPIKRFEKNLQKIIAKAKNFSKNIVFIGATNVDESQMPRKGVKIWKNDRIQKYNEIIKKVCDENGIPFLELFGIIDHAELPDGLHPNAKGHEKMFQKIKGFLQKEKII